MYVCPQNFSDAKRRQPPQAWRSISTKAYGHTVDVHNIVDVTNMSSHDNLSPTVKICRRYRCMASSSASQEDYRLVCGVCC